MDVGLIMQILLPMVHMGYDPFNVFIAFVVSTKPKGSITQAGCLPHFLMDAPAFLGWLARVCQDVFTATQDGELLSALLGLSSQVNSWWLLADRYDPEAWLVIAHRILIRFDLFLATLDLAALTTDSSEQREEAVTRVRRLNLAAAPRSTYFPVTHYPKRPSGVWGGGAAAIKRHRSEARPANKQCSHHGACNHTTAECQYLKKTAAAGK